jgi:hypothetical protein
MRRSLGGRVESLERKEAGVPRTYFVFLEDGETDIGPERDRMIASGPARPTDRFIPFRWKPTRAGG